MLKEVKILVETFILGLGLPPRGVIIITTLLRAHANGVIRRLVIERPRSCGRCRLGRRAWKRRVGRASHVIIGAVVWLVLILRLSFLCNREDAFPGNGEGIDQ